MNLAIVAPVYNDWNACRILVDAIDKQLAQLDMFASIFLIDDGSTLCRPIAMFSSPLRNVAEIAIVELACNLGHQRAIAVGLAHVNRLGTHDVVIVMDSDGEDRPEDILALVEAHKQNFNAIIVAKRGQRSEGTMFALYYSLYKFAFVVSTGRKIDFGNFCLLPKEQLGRIVYMSELWNHLAATIMRSRAPVLRVPTVRGIRYASRSSMQFITLVGHGVSAMAAFTDVVLLRIVVFSTIVALMAGLGALGATILRAYTDLAIPGWATTVVGLALVMIGQVFSLSLIAAFMTMNNRNALLFVPAINGLGFIRNIEALKIDAH